jgi:putative transposase
MANQLQGIKVRIYPTEEQEVYIAKLLGCRRFVYNQCLAKKKEVYEATGKSFGLADCGKYLTEMRNGEEFPWLKETSQDAQSRSLQDLETAFKNFFDKRSDFPVFKKRRDKQSCRFTGANGLNGITGNRLSLVKQLKNILFKCSKHDEIALNKYQDNIKSVTLERTRSGKYTLSILIEKPLQKKLPKTDKVIGIDIGIKDFVVTSDGERFENIKTIRNNEKKLKKLRSRMDKKQKGSKNREKARLKLARLHEKLSNRKEHYLHQISNKLLNENQVIVFETLNIKGMIANHCLAKSIGELSAFRFKSITKYKGNWYGRDIVDIDQFYPSSKLCECCEEKNDALTLADRVWVCPNCSVEHDRDLNAACNIRNEGIRILAAKAAMKLGPSSPDVKSVERTTKTSMKQKKNVTHSSE